MEATYIQSEGKRRGKGAEAISKEIITKNFPYLIEGTIPQN